MTNIVLKRNLERLARAVGKTPEAEDAFEQLAVTKALAGRPASVNLAATSTTQTDAWIPADIYAQQVFMGLHSKRVLGALAAALGVNVQQGEGGTVQVRFFPKRTAQGPIAEGVALSQTATGSLTTKSITLSKYGDYDILTQESIDYTAGPVKDMLLDEMGAALAEKLEQVTYDVLKNAASTQTYTLDISGTLSYEDILRAEAKAKKDKKVRPDFLIIAHDLVPDLLLDPNLTKTVNYGEGTVALPGEVGRIGNVRIIAHDLAVAKATTTGTVQGILIDSTRAFGEAFGRPLTFEEERVPEDDTWKEVCWVRYGAAVLDPDAIMLLKNA